MAYREFNVKKPDMKIISEAGFGKASVMMKVYNSFAKKGDEKKCLKALKEIDKEAMKASKSVDKNNKDAHKLIAKVLAAVVWAENEIKGGSTSAKSIKF